MDSEGFAEPNDPKPRVYRYSVQRVVDGLEGLHAKQQKGFRKRTEDLDSYTMSSALKPQPLNAKSLSIAYYAGLRKDGILGRLLKPNKEESFKHGV